MHRPIVVLGNTDKKKRHAFVLDYAMVYSNCGFDTVTSQVCKGVDSLGHLYLFYSQQLSISVVDSKHEKTTTRMV